MHRPDPQRRLGLARVGLAVAIAYFAAGGVLALWFPEDGMDLYVSYVAGRCSTEHVSPYDRAAYRTTWRNLDTPAALADTVDLPFAYPPFWIPLAAGLSLLPWSAALALWKIANVALLVGSMLLTFRLLAADGLDPPNRSLAWCFALVLSPTLSVMTTGQSSIVVLFALLATNDALCRGRTALAGAALTLGMIKPQLALPFVMFLAFRRERMALGIMTACVAVLTWIGLAMSDSTLATYAAGVATYAKNNEPSSHIAVGIASLFAHLTSMTAGTATLIGLLVGMVLIAAVSLRHRHDDRRHASAALPVLLYLAPLCFRCNGYDLVALIPLFVWSRTASMPIALRRAIGGLCAALIVPRGAIRFAFDALGRGGIPEHVARIGELSFRSWILLLLLPFVVAAVRLRASPR